MEQKLTEAAAVCNLPCREVEGVREKAVTLRLFLFILDGTFGQIHTHAESLENNAQTFYRTVAYIFLSEK